MKSKKGGTNSINNAPVQRQLMDPTMQNSFNFLIMIGPYLLIGFFVLMSFFNKNLKGLIYVVGICGLIVVTKIFSATLGPMLSLENRSIMCNMFGLRFLGDGLPFSILVYFFTLGYLFFPMYKNNIMNYPMIITIMLLAGADLVVQMSNNCTKGIAVFISILIGVMIGFIWSTVIQNNAPDLLYHTDYVSDKLACSMPSQQKFKCQVYKNGELITTMTK